MVKIPVWDLLYLLANTMILSANLMAAFQMFGGHVSLGSVLLWDTPFSRALLFVNAVWATLSFYWIYYKRMRLENIIEEMKNKLESLFTS